MNRQFQERKKKRQEKAYAKVKSLRPDLYQRVVELGHTCIFQTGTPVHQAGLVEAAVMELVAELIDGR